MPTLKNVSPLGMLDVPAIGRTGDNGIYADPDANGYRARTAVPGSGCLEPGEEFGVPASVAAELLEQEANFSAVKPAKTKDPEPAS